MSDNDDIEVESDEDSSRFPYSADKRAHHNALERKRRDHIKDSFHGLRDSVPALQGEKASRAQILDKATEYIQYMRRKNHTHQQDIDDLKRQNALLEQQEPNQITFQQNLGAKFLDVQSFKEVRALEKAKSSSQLQSNYSSSESETEEPQSRKKLRMDAS
ncbi:hypothetical protein XELAEV_18040156mg [Xenopus laevis]|uniref:Protein max n=1 Tax=Xenopus laevis TaxID=8355 RepID=A0A974H908_XENLA|nr:hypothetical protein XELAEV_18040156mg [Xenopus laevis]